MSLKYKFTELFRNRFPVPDKLYDQLSELDRQINDGADAVPVVKNDIKLNKTALKKAFGDPTKFKNIAIIHNSEGSYLLVASPKDKSYKIVSLENI